MVYASSKDALRRPLTGIHAEIQGTDFSEVSHEVVLSRFVGKWGIQLMTRERITASSQPRLLFSLWKDVFYPVLGTPSLYFLFFLCVILLAYWVVKSDVWEYTTFFFLPSLLFFTCIYLCRCAVGSLLRVLLYQGDRFGAQGAFDLWGTGEGPTELSCSLLWYHNLRMIDFDTKCDECRVKM